MLCSQTTPARRQGVHPTPWQAATAAHSTQMLPAERRCPDDARATPGRTSDPLASSKGRTQRRLCVRDVCEVVCERLYCDVVLCDVFDKLCVR